MLRAKGPIEASALDILRCMTCDDFKKDWDMNNDSSKFLEKIGANAYTAYKRTKKKAVVSARDFVVD
jgi:hypothetical protein